MKKANFQWVLSFVWVLLCSTSSCSREPHEVELSYTIPSIKEWAPWLDNRYNKQGKVRRRMLMSYEKVQARDWMKPPQMGIDIDEWFVDADAFVAMLDSMDMETLPIFSIYMVDSPDGTEILAPVDRNEKLWHRGEVIEEIDRGISLLSGIVPIYEELLNKSMVHSSQIVNDLLFGKDISYGKDVKIRRDAEIVFFKIGSGIKALISYYINQREMFNRFTDVNYIVSAHWFDKSAMDDFEIDYELYLEISDEEMAAYNKEEAAASLDLESFIINQYSFQIPKLQ